MCWIGLLAYKILRLVLYYCTAIAHCELHHHVWKLLNVLIIYREMTQVLRRLSYIFTPWNIFSFRLYPKKSLCCRLLWYGRCCGRCQGIIACYYCRGRRNCRFTKRLSCLHKLKKAYYDILFLIFNCISTMQLLNQDAAIKYTLHSMLTHWNCHSHLLTAASPKKKSYYLLFYQFAKV